MATRNRAKLLASFAVPIVLAVACGGESTRSGNSGDATGGTSAMGGTGPSGGTSPTGGIAGTSSVPPGSCSFAGVIYPNGASFPASDGCNTCFCSDGQVACTLIDCPPPSECELLIEAHQEALAGAKRCEPGAGPSECVMVAPSALQCGCPTVVNPSFDLSLFDELLMAWSVLGCGADVVCGACPPPPTSGYCSDEGVCQDLYPE